MQHVDMLTTTDCIDLKGDQAGGCWHVDHNTGLVYMRSRPIVLEFTAAWKRKIETTRDIMIRDQAALNLLMREGFHSKTWPPPPDPSGVPPVRRTHLAPTSPHLAPTSHLPLTLTARPAPSPRPLSPSLPLSRCAASTSCGTRSSS